MKKELIVNELTNEFEPVINEQGYELYYIEYVKENNANYLRFYIDKAEVGVGFKDCEVVSRRINEIFDEKQMEKNIDVDFLEVSSPGIDRILATTEHFNRVIEKNVVIILSKPVEGKKKYTGILKSANDNEIVVDVEGQNINIPREKIKKANLQGEI
ncbi:ribosome maturation factor RimP [Clostridium massiliamazoniense]|uniref:ribosome maturation factor RimP n=1 Tax=Clostridium massiliamazoniense TaxID=1347366 RepID=UPI0006D7C1BB|nr:ribosome maturation factor RimP [Clostridium massiliamazoniense]